MKAEQVEIDRLDRQVEQRAAAALLRRQPRNGALAFF